MTDEPKVITVGAGQMTARLMNEADHTLASIEALIEQSADKRVDLLVLPECAYPAYLLGSITSYRAGDHMSGEAYVGWLCERAARYDMHIVSGFVEDNGPTLRNGAVLIDAQGREVGRTHKRFLWHIDHEWFEAGDEVRSFDTALGRIGMVICAETRTPEILATLVAEGMEILAMPTCWVNGSRERGRYVNPQIDFLMEARAREFSLPVICADKCGYEQGNVGYVGTSRVYLADGSIAAEAPPEGEMVITARIVPEAAPRVPVRDAHRQRILSDRAPTRPAAEPARLVRLAAVPTAVANGAGDAFLKNLREKGVHLLVTNAADKEAASHLARRAGPFGIHAIGFAVRDDVFDFGPARVGCAGGQEVKAFGAARALSFDGAELLLFFDAPDDLALLRTRSIENRVFVAAVGQSFAVITNHNGKVLAQSCGDRPVEIIAEIDLAKAGNKFVAPGTDTFDERQPSLYRF